MVLSGSKKVSSISSIKNRSQGGGSKKAGLPPKPLTSWTIVHYKNSGYPTSLSNIMTNRFSVFPHISRPIGIDTRIKMS